MLKSWGGALGFRLWCGLDISLPIKMGEWDLDQNCVDLRPSLLAFEFWYSHCPALLRALYIAMVNYSMAHML